MNLAIAIPARWGSTRFPGKPLAKIGGQTMLARVVELARGCSSNIFVATEDQRIADHAAELDVPCFITPESCPTGSDRVLAALKQMDTKPEFVINLQGDAPFTPPSVLAALVQSFKDNPRAEVITPVHQLSWDDLDRLRAAKKTTPFSGTTAIIDQSDNALWFSKTILPAMRNEEKLRSASSHSPVFQHLGLYGFRTDILEKFCALPQGVYEQLEGLEQLRMIENGIKVTTVKVEIESGVIQSGIDTPEDLARAEALLK